MTAEPTGHVMWTPDPIRQRAANYTVVDVLELPDDAPRVELNDGVMVVVPSSTLGHQDTGALLWMWFRQHAPEGYRPGLAVGVATGFKNSLEPDVVLLREPVVNSHFYDAAQTAIAVEIVSPSTRKRDRLQKPVEYAAAGVTHYWRIEQDPLHVFAYDLVGSEYQLVADSTDELVLSAPFEIRLAISDITP
ncbi:Uma2 family endonuclease [Actinoplanes sp. NPDC049599]|uniref:Uma2 family endonuclease n=1 Tax=Actinoplanes sp. NPDC049599 TaxID=3363903 RepID=UPI0037A86157